MLNLNVFVSLLSYELSMFYEMAAEELKPNNYFISSISSVLFFVMKSGAFKINSSLNFAMETVVAISGLLFRLSTIRSLFSLTKIRNYSWLSTALFSKSTSTMLRKLLIGANCLTKLFFASMRLSRDI